MLVIIGNNYQLTEKELKELDKRYNHVSILDRDKYSDERLTDFIQENKKYIKKIVLNLKKSSSELLIKELTFLNIDILDMTTFLDQVFNKCNVVYNEYDYEVLNRVNTSSSSCLIVKNIFDKVFAFAVLVILSPIFAFIGYKIKKNSPNGNIFYGHKRLGKDGKYFYCYKFRTMVPDADKKLQELLDMDPVAKEEFEKDFKLKNDPRIIPGIGSFLRKTSLDELPQFYNVLMGEMSIVGPRPIVSGEVEKYHKYITKFISIKPGVTGLWQVSGRNDIDYEERVAMDMEYIDNRSFLLDIKIIFKTVLMMLRRDNGAY